MRRVCARELKAARKAYASLQTKEGDGFVEAFEEAIDEGGEGGSYVRLFEILKMATGKGKKIKWRGQKQEGKAGGSGAGPHVASRAGIGNTAIQPPHCKTGCETHSV